MLEIKILVFGKLKEEYWQSAANEYLKRLKPYARIKVEELKPVSFSKFNKETAKKEEGEKLLKHLSPQDKGKIFLLTESGQSFDSLNFSRKILKERESICFVIGGALGFSQDILNNYQQISLSPLTFTHEMARVILLEQIYRGISLIKGKNYHY